MTGFFEEDLNRNFDKILEGFGVVNDVPKMLAGVVKDVSFIEKAAHSFKEHYDLLAKQDEANVQALDERALEVTSANIELLDEKKAELEGKYKVLGDQLNEIEGKFPGIDERDFQRYDAIIDGAFKTLLEGDDLSVEALAVVRSEVSMLLTEEDKENWRRKTLEGRDELKEYLEELNIEFKGRVRKLPEQRYQESIGMARKFLIESKTDLEKVIESLKKTYGDLHEDAKQNGIKGLLQRNSKKIALAEVRLKNARKNLKGFLGYLKHAAKIFMAATFSAALGVDSVLAISFVPGFGGIGLAAAGFVLAAKVLVGPFVARKREFKKIEEGFELLDNLTEDNESYLDVKEGVQNLIDISEEHGVSPRDPDEKIFELWDDEDSVSPKIFKDIVKPALLDDQIVEEESVEEGVEFNT